MNPIFIIGGVILWLLGIVFTVCLFHGAEKLRRQQDAALAAAPPQPYSAGYAAIDESPSSFAQTAA